MICVELSSVHTTFDDNINDAILHAIFADGCAAAVLKGARKADCPKVKDISFSSVSSSTRILVKVEVLRSSHSLSHYFRQPYMTLMESLYILFREHSLSSTTTRG